MGFFKESELLTAAPAPLVARCGQCGLWRHCASPKMPVAGTGAKRILVVGEAPGQEEARQGKPFVGDSGRLLRDALRGAGVDPDQDCWMTNAVICHPKDKHGRNRTPSDREIEFCEPNLYDAIRRLRPNVVVPLGASAVRAVLSRLWNGKISGAKQWAGFQIPCTRTNAWICPTFHPAFCLYERNPLVEKTFREHLTSACALAVSPPWQEVPNLERQVRVEFDDEKAARLIDEMADGGEMISLDYETNALKPDSEKARIFSCAVSDGATAVAYPWVGDAVAATGRLIRSKAPKILYNAQFEQRWTFKEFGHGIRNIAWDGMLAAHVLDNRPGVKSLKFQAFVRFGVAPYNDKVESFLGAEDKSGNAINRVAEVDLRSLLIYCGIDALLEHRVALAQMQEMRTY